MKRLHTLPLLVVKGEGVSLLGQDWLKNQPGMKRDFKISSTGID